jgi:hypothetical protein
MSDQFKVGDRVQWKTILYRNARYMEVIRQGTVRKPGELCEILEDGSLPKDYRYVFASDLTKMERSNGQ